MGIVTWSRAAVLACVCLMSPASFAEEPREFSSAAWTWFGAYEPKNPQSLSEIPAPVRARLMAHLRSRLGVGFVERLEFTGGQVIDFAELRRVDPDSKDYKWEVPAYILDFAFKMSEAGIASYTVQISLRSDGSVLEEIGLPKFAASPGKLALTPLSEAIDVAVSRGFARDQMDVDLRYDEKIDSLVWTFDQKVADDGVLIDFMKIDVSAHTGEVLKVYESQAIR
jgi:hypothetical protein